jgi:hypothetical protein
MVYLRFSGIVLSTLLLLNSCEKSDCPNAMKLTISNPTPAIGESFEIKAPSLSGNGYFRWSGPGNFGSSTSNTLTISNAKYAGRGWYHCAKTMTDCNTTIRDSIFVDVKLKQEAPPCTPTNNLLAFSSIPNVTLNSVTFALDPVFNGMALGGSGAFGLPSSFKVLFNSYNGVFDPPDGVYKTTGVATFDVTQDSISFIYSSGYFHCQPGQKIYVSHIGGKLSVKMCNLIFSYVGTGLTTQCTGQLTRF